MGKDKKTATWSSTVPNEDYAAAAAFLALVMVPARVPAVIKKLRGAGIQAYRAADLFRASRTKLPKKDDRPCREAIAKIRAGEAIAPVLLVRDPPRGTVIIADGYHRVCAAVRIDPDVVLHCKIV